MLAAALANRIGLHRWSLQHPEVRDERIEGPWIIVGLPRTGTSLLSMLASSTTRRWTLLIAFLAAFWLLDDRMRNVLPWHAYLIALYTVGLLHFVYDAVIWKVRRPAVATGFGIEK